MAHYEQQPDYNDTMKGYLSYLERQGQHETMTHPIISTLHPSVNYLKHGNRLLNQSYIHSIYPFTGTLILFWSTRHLARQRRTNEPEHKSLADSVCKELPLIFLVTFPPLHQSAINQPLWQKSYLVSCATMCDGANPHPVDHHSIAGCTVSLVRRVCADGTC